MALLVVGSVLRAEELSPETQTPSSAQVHQLIVPMNEDREPFGEYDYLPLEFYDAIHRQAAEGGAGGQDWLVRRATYRTAFSWLQQRSSLELLNLTVVYQLGSLRSGQTIVFPWNGGSQDVQLLEGRLAGQPIELKWNADRSSFSFRIEGTGEYQLELVLQPLIREVAGERSLKFEIPGIAHAQLHIQLPFGAPKVQVDSARGSVYVNPESGEQTAELGPTTTLELRWPAGIGDEMPLRRVDVQQLMWLKVRPEGPTRGGRA